MAAANASSTLTPGRSTSRFPGPFFKDPKRWIPRTPPQGPVPKHPTQLANVAAIGADRQGCGSFGAGKDTEGKDTESLTWSQFRSYWRQRRAESCGSQHKLMRVGKPPRKVQKSEGSLSAADTADGIADGESAAAKTAARLSRLAAVEEETEAEQAELVEEEADAAELAAFTPASHDSETDDKFVRTFPRKEEEREAARRREEQGSIELQGQGSSPARMTWKGFHDNPYAP